MADKTNNGVEANTKLRFSLDLRMVIGLLLVAILVMLFIWKPWNGNLAANSRTIEVRGEATVTSAPDEFVFYPSYEFKNADKTAALSELSKKSDEIVAKLKELGVPESGIQTASSASGGPYVPMPETTADRYNLSLTVTVTDRSVVQKVQDYLVTTAPSGSVSPLANFSKTKRKQLEDQARGKAVDDAKNKAEETAKKLGFKVSKVKTVSDAAGFSIMPFESSATSALDAKGAAPSLGVHPGENELPYSVTVVYYIR